MVVNDCAGKIFQQKKKEKKTAGTSVIVYDAKTAAGEKKGL